MLASFRSMSVVPWILFAQASSMMDYVPSITATQPKPTRAAGEIRDRGGVFGRAAVLRAQEALGEVYRRQRIPVQVETVRSLDGAWIADVAQRRATSAGADRLYILVAGEEREVGIVGARHGPASRLTDQQRETIRRSFLGPLQAGKPDDAIDQGIRAIGTTLDAAATNPRPSIRNALVPGAILLAALAALVASRVLVGNGRRGRGRRMDSACGQADGAPSAAAELPRAVSAGGRVAPCHTN